MIKKNYILIVILLFFLNIVLVAINAEEKNIEIDGDPDPEFIIHWRYSDFPNNNERIDTVVGFIENSVREAWQKFIVEWGFDKPIDKTIDIYVTDGEHPFGPLNKVGNIWHVTLDGTAEYIYIRENTHQDYYEKYNIYSPSEEASFLRSVSHEIFHAVQRSYGITGSDPKRDWIIEGSASFIQSVINPDAVF